MAKSNKKEAEKVYQSCNNDRRVRKGQFLLRGIGIVLVKFQKKKSDYATLFFKIIAKNLHFWQYFIPKLGGPGSKVSDPSQKSRGLNQF